jgi:serine/threonine protein kinase
MLSGYKEIHERSVIHRDIKPENVMFKNGKLKIVDFGFAKLTSGEKLHTTCLGTATFMGTYIY